HHAQVCLVHEQFVRLVADQSAWARGGVKSRCEGTGAGDPDGRTAARADRLEPGARKAEGALRRTRLAVLVYTLPAREVAEGDRIRERVAQGQRQPVDVGLLPVEVAVAEVVARI